VSYFRKPHALVCMNHVINCLFSRMENFDSPGSSKHVRHKENKWICQYVVACWKGLNLTGISIQEFIALFVPYQPAAHFKRGQLVLRLLCDFRVCIFVCPHLSHNNYVTYIVAMRPYFSWLRRFRRLLCVATKGSLAQLGVRDGYWEAEAM